MEPRVQWKGFCIAHLNLSLQYLLLLLQYTSKRNSLRTEDMIGILFFQLVRSIDRSF